MWSREMAEVREQVREQLAAIRQERAEQAQMLDVYRRWLDGTYLPPKPQRRRALLQRRES